ncbi:unnamed protein product [Brassica rapa]|uniref:Uncharacterized protein n=1 Tax=Brassica campestris TaxID=3711 RepID=A0A8D9G6B9_BRACM|nr:unnamed protein product [Brassica rapa]
MSTKNLDRGTGPLRLGAGRVWADYLVSRKTAGLAGWYCATASRAGLTRRNPHKRKPAAVRAGTGRNNPFDNTSICT